MAATAPTSAPYIGRIIFALIVVALFFYICAPFIIPITMGAVFAILFFPYMNMLHKRKISRSVAAGLLTITITFILILPLSYLIYMGARTGLQQLGHVPAIKALQAGQGTSVGKGNGTVVVGEALVATATHADWLEDVFGNPRVHRVIESVSTVLPFEPKEIQTNIRDIVQEAAVKLGNGFAAFIGQLPAISMALAMVLVSLFFFLRDGASIVDVLRSYSFFTPQQTNKLIKTFGGMCRSVIIATVASGLAQALIFFTGMLVCGVPKAALTSLIVFFASFVPLVGAAPVTFGVVIYQFMIDRPAVGIGLGVVAIIITVVDNIVRPWVLKDSGNLHPLVAFVSAFGGLQAFGVTGVFLGPIIAAMFMVMLQILFKE